MFKGIIVKHRVRVRKNGTLLSLECRDKAVRMTSGLKSRYYTDTTDSDILDELSAQYGLDREVAGDQAVARRRSSSTTATDWDFLVCRAEANGHVVAGARRQGHRRPAGHRRRARRHRQFGATVLELDAEIDARWQVKGVTANGVERRPTRSSSSSRRRRSRP